MKKLNNKGMTTIEVIICFVLISVISVSMYGTISSFNEKRITEEYKEQITTYKNILTKDIQDDLVKIGLTHAEYSKTYEKNAANEVTKIIHTVNCNLKDGSTRTLKITQSHGYSRYHVAGGDYDDYYMIEYGTTDGGSALIEYPLPDLGTSDEKNSSGSGTHKVKDLSINNISINLTDENVLSIYIGLYHPSFGTRYAIKLVTPINYDATSSKTTTAWNYHVDYH